MSKKVKLPEARNFNSSQAVVDAIAEYIVQASSHQESISILEAGCGGRWGFELGGIPYTLTGVDLDQNALDRRKNQQKDLDIAICADLRNVLLDPNSFDIIYCKNVLEHIDGAEVVLNNFILWLKPNGTLILVFPNRDSTYSFLTRITPHWIHVLYKKNVQGLKNAGKPGHDPYPVIFDKVVSRKGIYKYCEKNALVVKAEYRMDGRLMSNQIVWFMTRSVLWVLSVLMFNKLTFNYRSLAFFIKKSNLQSSAQATL
jgi:SAM-dependent methyltransferase